jgi:hypothetical protein
MMQPKPVSQRPTCQDLSCRGEVVVRISDFSDALSLGDWSADMLVRFGG